MSDLEKSILETTDLNASYEAHKTRKAARREFLTRLGSAGLGVAAGALIAGCGGGGSNSASINTAAQGQSSGAPTVNDVLNFALNLEYLEAEFYSKAATGNYLSTADTQAPATVGTYGATTGGPTNGSGGLITFSDATLNDYVQELYHDELAHVRDLRSVLGSAAIVKPALNLDALGVVTNLQTFLTVSRAFEDTGVSAYGGAAQYLISNTTVLTAAARILAVEAYHAGNLRLRLVQNNIPVSPLDSLDIPPTATTQITANPTALVSPTANQSTGALAVIRTPGEVLALVLGSATATAAAGTTAGGFFPNGVNYSNTNLRAASA